MLVYRDRLGYAARFIKKTRKQTNNTGKKAKKPEK